MQSASAPSDLTCMENLYILYNMKVRKTILVEAEKWKQFRSKLLLLDKSVTIQISEWIDNFLNNESQSKTKKTTIDPFNEDKF